MENTPRGYPSPEAPAVTKELVDHINKLFGDSSVTSWDTDPAYLKWRGGQASVARYLQMLYDRPSNPQ